MKDIQFSLKSENNGMVKFSLTPLRAREALKLQAKLLKAISPVFKGFKNTDVKDNKSVERSGLEALGELLKDFPDELLDFLIETYSNQCSYWVNDRQGGWVLLSTSPGGGFDECFNLENVLIFKWLAKCLEIQFSDYLKALKLENGVGGMLRSLQLAEDK